MIESMPSLMMLAVGGALMTAAPVRRILHHRPWPVESAAINCQAAFPVIPDKPFEHEIDALDVLDRGVLGAAQAYRDAGLL